MNRRRQSSRWWRWLWVAAARLQQPDFDSKPRSALKNDLRECLFLSVRNRQRGILHSELQGKLSRLAMESHRRAAARHANDLAIAPPNSMIPPGAQSFHRRFLGRKARSIT